jgi:hypothetical protein
VPRLRLHFGFGEIARPAAARSGSGLTGSGDPQELLVGFQKLDKIAKRLERPHHNLTTPDSSALN